MPDNFGARDLRASDPASLLPPDWDKAWDVLLLIGQGADRLAAPFLAHGLQRLYLYLPEGGRVDGAVVVQSRLELTRALRQLSGHLPNRFASIRSPWSALSPAEMDELASLFQVLLRTAHTSRAAHDALGLMRGLNAAQNLPALATCPSVGQLAGAFAGVPLVIVGAGPSLDKNLHLLQGLAGRALVLVVNRSLRSLQAAGVRADVAMALEPQNVGYLFDGIDLSATHLALSASVKPKLFALGARGFLSFTGHLTAESWALPGETLELDSAGSVSCSALSLGLCWGCDPIVLIGQDLSFPGGAYYAASGDDGQTRAVHDPASGQVRIEGYCEGKARTERLQQGAGAHSRGIEIPGYDGGTVLTSTEFNHFREWFTLVARDLAARPHRPELFNCTEGGAHIDGWTHQPLARVSEGWAPLRRSVQSVLEAATPTEPRARAIVATARDLAVALPLAMEAAQACLRAAAASIRAGAVVPELDARETELKRLLPRLPPLKLMGQAEIRAATQRAASATTLEASLEASMDLYQVVLRHGHTLLPAVEAADQRLRSLSITGSSSG